MNVRSTTAALALLLAVATQAFGGEVSTTTTTQPAGTTTTTMFIPTDVTGGGRFEGSYPKDSFDTYVFQLDEPRVLIAETTNGFGGCPGDTIVELRHPDAPGDCMGMYGDELPCIAVDDDSGISLCSKLVKHILEPGEYIIRVASFGGAKLNRYFLTVTFVEVECGNDVVEITEECDDGNVAAGDCCSPACRIDAPATPCDDDIFCNGADQCAGGTCSVHLGNPCPGPDGDSDCSEMCNEATAACISPDPGGSACDDNNDCTPTSTCNGSGTCVIGVVDCDDDNACTTDDCIGDPPDCQHTDVPSCETTTTLVEFGCGDSNGDGDVKASDALSVLQAAVGGPQCDDEFCLCDVNGNGSLAASDALAVLKFAVGAPVVLNCVC